MVAETFSNRGSAVLNGLRFDGLCCDGGVGLDSVAVSDGQCLMVVETLRGRMTALLSLLMVGIYCRFNPFVDIWLMGWGFLLIGARELGL